MQGAHESRAHVTVRSSALYAKWACIVARGRGSVMREQTARISVPEQLGIAVDLFLFNDK